MSGTDYNEGDLVEAVNEDGAKLTGILGKRDDGLLYLGAYHWIFPTWVAENAGFSTITVIEKAKPQLPTEPGYYESADFHIADDFSPYRLRREGHWELRGQKMSPTYMADRMPLARLAPVAEVLDKVTQAFRVPRTRAEGVKIVAAEYGVTL